MPHRSCDSQGDHGNFCKRRHPALRRLRHFSELAEEVKAGAEEIITRHGERCVALIDAKRLDYRHQLGRERIHLLRIAEAGKGLDDAASSRVKDACSAITAPKRRRNA